ncbi:MAG: hypothetical protein WAS36_05150 [Candidatus Saccharimonadales bacterium]
MSTRARFLSLGIATSLVAGCGANSPETISPETYHVGDNQWVKTTEELGQLPAGSDCVVHLGSALILENGGIVYASKRTADEAMKDELLKDSPAYDANESLHAGATECPDGAKVDMTQDQAKAQEQQYIAFEKSVETS